MKVFLGVSVVFYVTGLVCSVHNFNYESMHKFGLGRRVIPGVRRQLNTMQSNAYEYPQPLPEKPNKRSFSNDPYPSIYQGKRTLDDVRVIRKSFDYPAAAQGHKVICEEMLYCTISYISVETTDGVPIILRGGAGYQHFSIVVRSQPGSPLKGTIRVYCKKGEDYDQDTAADTTIVS